MRTPLPASELGVLSAVEDQTSGLRPLRGPGLDPRPVGAVGAADLLNAGGCPLRRLEVSPVRADGSTVRSVGFWCRVEPSRPWGRQRVD